MASKGISTASCSKCGVKHTRPVGVRCKRLLNISAPAMRDSSDTGDESQLIDSQLPLDTEDQGQNSSGTGVPAPQLSHMESKLDLILKKMQSLEDKNQELEEKMNSRQSQRSVQVSHSSPKRSHTCSNLCSHRSAKKGKASGSPVMNFASDSVLQDVGDSHCSSIHASHGTDDDTIASQPSLQWLKQDAKTQRQVQQQLQKLQGLPRSATSRPGKSFKSGLLRSGDNDVKIQIAWPHHHCFPTQGGSLPEYKELSPLQFMVGFLGCLQEETSNTVRENMMEYGRHLFQDAIETNWVTARHAHLVLLQDIERGKCSWRRPDMVEKVRIRNTARVIQTKNNASAPKSYKNSSKEKVCTEFNANNCKSRGDHVVDGIINKHACSHCFQEVGKMYGHKLQDCFRRKSSDLAKDAQKNS